RVALDQLYRQSRCADDISARSACRRHRTVMLWDQSCQGDIQLWPSYPIAAEQLQLSAWRRAGSTLSHQAEALAFPCSQQMAPRRLDALRLDGRERHSVNSRSW